MQICNIGNLLKILTEEQRIGMQIYKNMTLTFFTFPEKPTSHLTPSHNYQA